MIASLLQAQLNESQSPLEKVHQERSSKIFLNHLGRKKITLGGTYLHRDESAKAFLLLRCRVSLSELCSALLISVFTKVIKQSATITSISKNSFLLYKPFASRCLVISQMQMAPDTCTFNDRMIPSWGISTH
jgi:hypothetical protein